MSLLQLPGPESIKVLKVSHLPPSWIFADSALSRLVIDDFVWRIVFLRTSRKSNFFDVHFYWGTRWCSRSRHCARSRKVAGSISDGVIEIIHWHNPSGGTMALGFFILKQKWVPGPFPGVKADNLITFMCPLSWNLEALNSWNPQGLSRPVMGLLYLYFTFSLENGSISP